MTRSKVLQSGLGFQPEQDRKKSQAGSLSHEQECTHSQKMSGQKMNCPKCSKPVQADALGGICPECLMAAAISQPDSGNEETLERQGMFNAPTPESLSKAINSIEVLELLGHGGMGAVYLGRQITLDRPVALKIIAPKLGSDPDFAERFAREARTLARLNHPNIVTIYDFGRAGEFCYLVMELVEGVNLRDAIQSGGITPEQALSIVPRICEALQYAHDKGIVHRDIKPENILIGVDDQVKIADFGLAKLLDNGPRNFTLTATQQVLGTRNYMAPEQIEKPSTVDHRADIYSLGVVFYELLTGELPLGRFSLPSEKARVSGALDEVVLRTLEKEPGRRFQQASEFKTAMESAERFGESPLEPINGIHSEKPAGPEMATRKPPVIEGATGDSNPRRVSLPFSNDQIHGGLSQLHGIAHLGETSLEIEFRKHHLGISKSASRTVYVPYDSLASSQLTRGMFSNTLEIQGGSLEAFEEVPGSIQGRIQMTLDKKHDFIAEEFESHLAARITQHSPAGQVSQNAARAPSLAHVPFKIGNVHAGMAEASGIARVTNENLVVEYEVKDAFNVVKSSPRAALIPFDDIIAITFREGWFGNSIEIQTSRLDSVGSIPNSIQGKVKMQIRKRDRLLAHKWMAQALRMSGLPMGNEFQEAKPDNDVDRSRALGKRLLVPWLLLCLIPLCNMVVLLIAMFRHVNVNGITAMDMGFSLPLVPLGVIVGSVFMTLVSIVLFHLIQKQNHYHVVIALLILIALPVHVGVVFGFPLACWMLLILLPADNRSAFMH